MTNAPVLRSNNVELVPFSEPWNMEYLYQLMKSYPYDEGLDNYPYSRAKNSGRMFWLGYVKPGVLAGVAYLCYHKDVDKWTLDAYRDDRMLRTMEHQKTWSEETGKLLCDYFFSLGLCDILYSGVDVRNKLAIKLLERLGFEKVEAGIFLNHNYTLLLKRRESDGRTDSSDLRGK